MALIQQQPRPPRQGCQLPPHGWCCPGVMGGSLLRRCLLNGLAGTTAPATAA